MARVALIGENSAEYIETLLDIWNNGDCAVLLDWRIPYQTIIEMMKEARVGKCYIEKQQLDKGFDTLSEEIMFIPFEKNNNYAKYLPNEIYRKFNSNYSSDEAIILYSSGTTGKSKGIILSHYAINTNADAIIDYMKPSADDCIYIAKTLSHSSTLTGELLVALKTHAKLVVAPTIVPPRYILNKINELRVSIICLNPTLLSMFADEYQRSNHKISSLRTIYVSGSILNDKIYAKAQKVFPNITIYNVYGLTEAGPRVTAQRVDCCASNSVGKPIKGVAIAIVDEHGSPVVKGKHGIIHVNTQSQLSGYVSGENKQPSLFKSWLNTGDYGYIDENNELHITGRVDDVIILDSHKIYPHEIEKKIIESTSVNECVVVKIEYNSSEFMACLYMDKNNTEAEIRYKLQKKLPIYEIPRRFIKCKSIPHVLNGKISMADVKALIMNEIKKE